MRYNLLYKVGNNKYKTFTRGEYIKVSKAFDDLHKRATDKNFKIVSRAAGNVGVELCYYDGKQKVNLLICNDKELRLWWSEKIEY